MERLLVLRLRQLCSSSIVTAVSLAGSPHKLALHTEGNGGMNRSTRLGRESIEISSFTKVQSFPHAKQTESVAFHGSFWIGAYPRIADCKVNA